MCTPANRFAGFVCGSRLGMLCLFALQHSMQCAADIALHRSHCAASSAAAVQLESSVTKVSNLSHCRGGFGANGAEPGQGLLLWGWAEGILQKLICK